MGQTRARRISERETGESASFCKVLEPYLIFVILQHFLKQSCYLRAMSSKKATLVVTTINDPALLKDYAANFRRHGHLDQVEAIVIPDEKTPAAAYERCRSLSEEGLRITCPTIEEQERYLTGIGLPPATVPRNSDNRRNVGYLMAYGSGSDFLISIDDDNYCLEAEDYFGEHSIVCRNDVA